MKRTVTFFNYRPLTVIGLITALHILAYGLGYTIPTSGFSQTVLYTIVGQLVNQFYLGIFFILTGLYSIWAWLKDSEKHIAISSAIMAFFWLFGSFTYFVSGAYGLGVGIGLVWSLLSGYTAFAYKNREETVEWAMNQKFKQILNGEVDDDPSTMLH